jgi:hypothetical protein
VSRRDSSNPSPIKLPVATKTNLLIHTNHSIFIKIKVNFRNVTNNWRRMMPVKDLHEHPFDDATITKLEIFEKYVEAWLPVFIHSSHFNSANICDFFAGTGQDINGVSGSPMRISVYKRNEKRRDS